MLTPQRKFFDYYFYTTKFCEKFILFCVINWLITNKTGGNGSVICGPQTKQKTT